MKAYKYKSLNNIEYVLDIILYNRLYCANGDELNDPLESTFSCATTPESYVRFDKVCEKLKKYRVCSLSKEQDCPLLWGYYADGFRGAAIEVEVPDTAAIEVKYGDPLELINWSGPDDYVVKKILSTKHEKWSHENEFRILQTECQFFDARVTKVILGHKAIELAKAHTVREVCRLRDVEIEKAKPAYSPGKFQITLEKWE